MTTAGDQIDAVMDSLADETVRFLCDLIRIPSMRGNEGPVSRLLHSRMKDLCTHARLMPIPNSFKDDPL
jgi:hypothetical protein